MPSGSEYLTSYAATVYPFTQESATTAPEWVYSSIADMAATSPSGDAVEMVSLFISKLDQKSYIKARLQCNAQALEVVLTVYDNNTSPYATEYASDDSGFSVSTVFDCDSVRVALSSESQRSWSGSLVLQAGCVSVDSPAVLSVENTIGAVGLKEGYNTQLDVDGNDVVISFESGLGAGMVPCDCVDDANINTELVSPTGIVKIDNDPSYYIDTDTEGGAITLHNRNVPCCQCDKYAGLVTRAYDGGVDLNAAGNKSIKWDERLTRLSKSYDEWLRKQVARGMKVTASATITGMGVNYPRAGGPYDNVHHPLDQDRTLGFFHNLIIAIHGYYKFAPTLFEMVHADFHIDRPQVTLNGFAAVGENGHAELDGPLERATAMQSMTSSGGKVYNGLVFDWALYPGQSFSATYRSRLGILSSGRANIGLTVTLNYKVTIIVNGDVSHPVVMSDSLVMYPFTWESPENKNRDEARWETAMHTSQNPSSN